MGRDRLIQVLIAENDQLVDYISRRFGDRQFAQEVIQDVCLQVLQQAHIPHDIRIPLAFLRKISLNTAVDFYRKEQTLQKNICFDPNWQDQQQQSSMSLTMQELAVAKQQHEKVILQAIDQLPECCRDVFILAQIHHYSQQHIADALNISRGMVARHLARAYQDILPILLK